MPVEATDGSSRADAPDRHTIDPTDELHAWRFRCPHGHTTWEPTNGGLWCRSCANDHDIEDPHHHAVLDTSTGDTIPWSAITLDPPLTQ